MQRHLPLILLRVRLDTVLRLQRQHGGIGGVLVLLPRRCSDMQNHTSCEYCPPGFQFNDTVCDSSLLHAYVSELRWLTDASHVLISTLPTPPTPAACASRVRPTTSTRPTRPTARTVMLDSHRSPYVCLILDRPLITRQNGTVGCEPCLGRNWSDPIFTDGLCMSCGDGQVVLQNHTLCTYCPPNYESNVCLRAYRATM